MCHYSHIYNLLCRDNKDRVVGERQGGSEMQAGGGYEGRLFTLLSSVDTQNR